MTKYAIDYVPHEKAEWHRLIIEADTFRRAEDIADQLAADGDWFTWLDPAPQD